MPSQTFKKSDAFIAIECHEGSFFYSDDSRHEAQPYQISSSANDFYKTVLKEIKQSKVYNDPYTRIIIELTENAPQKKLTLYFGHTLKEIGLAFPYLRQLLFNNVRDPRSYKNTYNKIQHF